MCHTQDSYGRIWPWLSYMCHVRWTAEERFAFSDLPQVAVLGSWHKSINFGDKPPSRQERTTWFYSRTEKGSSEGQNLAVTGLGVPKSLDSGGRENLGAGQQHLHAGLLCAIFAQKRNGPSTSGRPRLVVQIRQLWKQNGRETLEAAPPRKPYTQSSKLSSRSET